MKKPQKKSRSSENKTGLEKPNLAIKGVKRETVIELMAKASLPGVGPVTIRKVLAGLASLEGTQNTVDDSLSSENTSLSLVDEMLGVDAFRLAALGPWGRRLALAMNKDKEGHVLQNNRVFYQREWEISQGEGIRWVDMYAEDFPIQLNWCNNAPLLLYVKGNLPTQYDYSLAIVGTRNMSPYGAFFLRQYMEELSKSWQDSVHKPIVVSGLARGVDTHAHDLALECGMVTLGVMANGLATVYPAQNRGLASRILKNGALISESPAYQSPDARLFANRNRIIAGICAGTLVTEAAARGGALITARYAQEYGRHVLAFPGRVTDQNYRGCLQMIMEGQALMTCSPHDLATLMQWPVAEWRLEGIRSDDGLPKRYADKPIVGQSKGAIGVKSSMAATESSTMTDNLGVGAAKIWSSMELHEPMVADQLWEHFPGDYPGFVCALFELESKGWVTRTPSGALVRLQ